MATFVCEKCGATIDTRCKPKKCAACGEVGCMCKEEKAEAQKRARNNHTQDAKRKKKNEQAMVFSTENRKPQTENPLQ